MNLVTKDRLLAILFTAVLGLPLEIYAQSSTTCVSPIQAVNTSTPRSVVGDGTAASCTEAAFALAIAKGGIIRFNCGSAATIKISRQLNLPITINTVIDGQNRITLDGQGITRILSFNSPNFRATRTTITIQNITFINGRSRGTPLPIAPAPCSQGTDVDGGGGAIYVRDGILRVINSRFLSNRGAPLGPDVAGGAIYTFGSLETTIVRSTFNNNSASNGGAVGALFGNPSIYNSTLRNNRAVGNGANNYSGTCPSNSIGNGGNGGAFYIDGAESAPVRVCGSRFLTNTAGTKAFGGAIFRAGGPPEGLSIDRSLLSGNRAPSGGAIYSHGLALSIIASTLTANVATAGPGGGVFATSSTLNFVNSTFHHNEAIAQLGGGINASDSGGSFLNLTFSGNKANSGPGYFGAALHADKSIQIKNTLFVNNKSQDCYNPMSCSWGNNSGFANMQWPLYRATCSQQDTPCAAGTTFRDPIVSSSLNQNGGPTSTLMPAANSPARGAGTNCPATDQRGVARVSSSCTLGAVE